LEGIQLRRAGGELQVEAWWRALAPTTTDYTTFVHLYDAGGSLLVTGDAPPLQGAFPTSMWQAGDLVADRYILAWMDDAESLGIGWYAADGGARLPAADGDGPLVDDTYRAAIP
jgi:hypothetical protein